MDVRIHSNDGDEVLVRGGWKSYSVQPGWLLLYDDNGDIELIPSERIECATISNVETRVVND